MSYFEDEFDQELEKQHEPIEPKQEINDSNVEIPMTSDVEPMFEETIFVPSQEPIEAIELPQDREEKSSSVDSSNGAGLEHVQYNPIYHERIQKPKKEKKTGRRILAAMVALTILNMALFVGTFLLGRQSGVASSSVSSKQELVATLQDAGSEEAIEETAIRQGELETAEIAKQVGPAVVGITSVVEGPMSLFSGVTQGNSQGSGIILSGDGYIVTNNHVVDGASHVGVTLNTGKEYEAKLVGTDAQSDLAVIKIEPEEELCVAKLGDSSALEVGDRVVAIGNPMGIEFFGSVTQGIVSAVNRSISIDNRTMNLIQTDAAINSGNSGGALINAYGEVIGINSVKVTASGIEGMGFAIPISEASPIVADLLEHGYVKGRPVIGISTRDVNEYMNKAYSWPIGVQVMEIMSEAAKSAGLQQGDIILAVNGEEVQTGEALNKIKDQHKPGDVLKMKVYKYATGLTEEIEVTLSEQLPG